MHLGTIFNDLDPFGTDFGASGEQFWSSGQRFLEVRDVNESLVPSCSQNRGYMMLTNGWSFMLTSRWFHQAQKALLYQPHSTRPRRPFSTRPRRPFSTRPRTLTRILRFIVILVPVACGLGPLAWHGLYGTRIENLIVPGIANLDLDNLPKKTIRSHSFTHHAFMRSF